MNNFYVYQYLRANSSKHGVAGSPYYIGKGVGRRAWARHRKVRPPKNQALIEILAKDLSEADAYQAEMLLIHLYGRINKGTGCLWNFTDGGDAPPTLRGDHHPMSGKKHSPESKAKMAAAKLGRKTGPHNAKWNANIAASLTGLVKSPETRCNISRARKGIKPIPRSSEHREAIRQAKLGVSRPDMVSGSVLQVRSALTRTGRRRGPYKRRERETK